MFQMMQQHCGKFICTTLYFNRASKEQRKHVQIYHVLWDGNVFPLHVFKEDSSLGASLSLAPVSLSWQRMGELSLGAAAMRRHPSCSSREMREKWGEEYIMCGAAVAICRKG